MDKKATKKLTIVALVIMLGTILVHTPVIGFAQAQGANKILGLIINPFIMTGQKLQLKCLIVD